MAERLEAVEALGRMLDVKEGAELFLERQRELGRYASRLLQDKGELILSTYVGGGRRFFSRHPEARREISADMLLYRATMPVAVGESYVVLRDDIKARGTDPGCSELLVLKKKGFVQLANIAFGSDPNKETLALFTSKAPLTIPDVAPLEEYHLEAIEALLGHVDSSLDPLSASVGEMPRIARGEEMGRMAATLTGIINRRDDAAAVFVPS